MLYEFGLTYKVEGFRTVLASFTIFGLLRALELHCLHLRLALLHVVANISV